MSKCQTTAIGVFLAIVTSCGASAEPICLDVCRHCTGSVCTEIIDQGKCDSFCPSKMIATGVMKMVPAGDMKLAPVGSIQMNLYNITKEQQKKIEDLLNLDR